MAGLAFIVLEVGKVDRLEPAKADHIIRRGVVDRLCVRGLAQH